MNPELAPLMITHESMSAGLLDVMEQALGLVQVAGLPPDEAVQVVQHAQLSVIHLVLRQPGRADSESRDGAEGQERQSEAIRALPPDRYRHVVEAAIPLSRCEDPDRYHNFGLDMLMAGIRAMAEERLSG